MLEACVDTWSSFLRRSLAMRVHTDTGKSTDGGKAVTSGIRTKTEPSLTPLPLLPYVTSTCVYRHEATSDTLEPQTDSRVTCMSEWACRLMEMLHGNVCVSICRNVW